VACLRPHQPKASFPVVNVRPCRDDADNSDRDSQKLPEARNRLMRHVGKGHADNCQREHGDVRQFPPQKARFAGMDRGFGCILRQFGFAHRQSNPGQPAINVPEFPACRPLMGPPMSFAHCSVDAAVSWDHNPNLFLRVV